MAGVWEREIAPGQSARVRRGAPFHLEKRSGEYMHVKHHKTTQQTTFRPQRVGVQLKKSRNRPRTASHTQVVEGLPLYAHLGMRRARQRGLQGEEREGGGGGLRWSAGNPLPGDNLLE